MGQSLETEIDLAMAGFTEPELAQTFSQAQGFGLSINQYAFTLLINSINQYNKKNCTGCATNGHICFRKKEV